ncbi:MAG TPA: choice-of-anchor K domain-containing protein [Burkholderiaceae bacterium]|nr:choice-of-anchor K domain-containing protein [Burkholderiaceae bacterium]
MSYVPMKKMRNGVLAATLVAGLLGGANEAAAYLQPPSISQTYGSGTVSFEFTYFSGPFAEFSRTGAIISTGLLNGAPIVPSGSTGTAYADPGSTRGYLTGSTAIAGDPSSVSLSYAEGSIPTVISFQPINFTNQQVGAPFTIGTFSFTNGQWYGAGQTVALNTPTVLGFTLKTTGTGGAASLYTQTLTGEIILTVNNPQPADYTTLAGLQAEADSISLLSDRIILQAFPTFSVYESFAAPTGATNTGSVNLVARFGSLYLDTFDTPTGGGFLTASPVPEPATLTLAVCGLLGLNVLRRRRR